jgi:hypothetical protein
VAAGGLAALLAAVGCGAAGTGAASSQTPQATFPLAPAAPVAIPVASQTGVPVVVSCEPGQRTVVRPTIVNGAAMSQVECVAAEVTQPVALARPFVQAPVAQSVVYRTPAPQPAMRDLGDTEVLPVASRSSVQPVRARQVVYDEPRREPRSVKKSAIIIGSSSGVGAGVGAAVGGKKGALIGAAIGGGGAALWDQITRRKN